MVAKLNTKNTNLRNTCRGFVLIEMLMVVGLIGLMAIVATVSFSALWGNLRFKRQAEELVNVFQMAYNAAAESDRRYEVILYQYEQAFIFREFTGYKMLEDALNEEDPTIIEKRFFNEKSMSLYSVQFDYYTQEELNLGLEGQNNYRFLAGKSGWQAGGRIVLLDEDGLPWTIVIHRFAKPVELFKGEVDIDLPQDATDVPL